MKTYKTYKGHIVKARPATDEEFKAHLALPHEKFSCFIEREDAWFYVKADGSTYVDHSPQTLGYECIDKDGNS